MGLTVMGASTGLIVNKTLTSSTYTRTAVTGLADVAVATIRTGEVTTSPFDGLLTVTSANADRAHRIAVAVSISRALFEKDVLPVKELEGMENMWSSQGNILDEKTQREGTRSKRVSLARHKSSRRMNCRSQAITLNVLTGPILDISRANAKL